MSHEFNSSLNFTVLRNDDIIFETNSNIKYDSTFNLQKDLTNFFHNDFKIRTNVNKVIHEQFHPPLLMNLSFTFAVLISGLIASLVYWLNYNQLLNRRLTEITRKAQAASQAKSDFLANVSHEIRTPLNGILGMGQILEETQLNEEQKDCLDHLMKSGSWLLELINDVLDFSKIELGKLILDNHPFHLKSFLEEIFHLLEPKVDLSRVKFILKMSDDCDVMLRADSFRLRQVLLNLLSNAIKFTENGQILFNAYKAKERYLFEVIDTGKGIKKNKQKLIFEEFSQEDNSTSREYGGTGLGLAIAKKIIDKMRGELKVESSIGAGSRFYFSIPLDEVNIETPKDLKKINHLSNENLNYKIIVAEDNYVNQVVISKMLDKLGCQYQICENGAEAIESINQEDFNLLLLDLHMPVLDGEETLLKIRQSENPHLQNLPIVILSANANKEDISHLLDFGANDYLTKPFKKMELQKAILKYARTKKRDS